MKKNQKGFTLIELLVVIAIIGVLSTLAVVSLNNARQKSRDSKRVGDVKQIQNALELYYNDANGYPERDDVRAGAPIAFNGTTYMAIVPTAPSQVDNTACTGNTTYLYNTVGNVGADSQGNNTVYTTYLLTYCLGSATGGLSEGLHTAQPGGMTQ